MSASSNKKSESTIDDVLALIRNLKTGNFLKQLNKTSDPKLKDLVDSLNDLTKILAAQTETGDDLATFILRKTELQTVFETMSDGLVIQDSAGKILQFNPAALSALGLTEEQLLGRTSVDPRWQAVREDGTDFPGQEHPAMVALRTGKKVMGVVMGIKLPSGEQHWLRINSTPFESKGDPTHNRAAGRHVITTFTNITALRNIEGAAELSLRRLEDAQATAKIGSWDFDLCSYDLNWSSENFKIFEIQKPQSKENLYKLYRECIHPDDIKELDRLVERATILGEDFIFNHRLVFENGKRIKHIQGIGKVHKDKSGKPMSISGTCQDVTDSKSLQDENRFILDALGIGLWKFNPVDQSLFWDKSLYKLFGVNESDFSGHYQAWESTLTPESKKIAVEELGQALRGEKEFDTIFEIENKTSGKRFVSGRGKVYRDQNGTPIMMYGVNMDVTAQKLGELEKDRITALLEAVLENIPSMIFVKDYKKNLTFSLLNKAGEILLGVKKEHLIGKNYYDIFKKEQADFFTDEDKEVFKKRSVHKIEKEEINTPSGKRFFETFKVPTFDHNNEPHLLIGISNDITEELKIIQELELERIKSLRNAKLASLGEMSAGVAHEINNPLAIISGSIGLLSKFSDNPEKFAAKIETIRRSCDRIARIVGGLRKFSRSGDKTNLKKHDLSKIIEDAFILTHAKSQRHSTPVTFDGKSSSIVNCDDVEIEQVLVNLINNAIDAVKHRPEKWVKVSLFDDSNSVVLRVTDSGPGIPESIRDKLFEPFFTTKKVSEGTGLGLSITKGILDEHKATITIDTGSPNTCFEIRFPSVEEMKNAS